MGGNINHLTHTSDVVLYNTLTTKSDTINESTIENIMKTLSYIILY